MDSKVSVIIKVVLFAVVVALAYWLYSIIQEPITFEKLKAERYSQVKNRLEQIRDAQKSYRGEFGAFADDFQTLIAFVDTGKQRIVERKDSSFMRYNEVYQQDMNVDTTIITVLGYTPVGESLFGKDFDASTLEMIPATDNEKFEMSASKISVNDVTVPVFEAAASNKKIFKDVYDKYTQFIEADYSLMVGSLTEPTLSGNWK